MFREDKGILGRVCDIHCICIETVGDVHLSLLVMFREDKGIPGRVCDIHCICIETVSDVHLSLLVITTDTGYDRCEFHKGKNNKSVSLYI